MLSLFQGFGIELEYMIVARDDLRILPYCDRILTTLAGELTDEAEDGSIAWSNELVAHVAECKTNGPADTLVGLAGEFHRSIRKVNEILRESEAMLLPTAMHPLFNGRDGLKLWPHGQNEIYRLYDRIFDCTGMGWSNLQSAHLNLPFQGDGEFTALHDAIRLLLPFLPALAASSPIVNGSRHDYADARLFYYSGNQSRIPQIAGKIIPERVSSAADYREKILRPMYEAIAPYDSEGLLQEEWLNSRAAIARFDRSAVEIRVLDVQESAVADLAIASLITEILRDLTAKITAGLLLSDEAQDENTLSEIFLLTAEKSDQAQLSHPVLEEVFSLPQNISGHDFWLAMIGKYAGACPTECREWYRLYSEEGSLSHRILHALKKQWQPSDILSVYRELAACLSENRLFSGKK